MTLTSISFFFKLIYKIWIQSAQATSHASSLHSLLSLWTHYFSLPSNTAVWTEMLKITTNLWSSLNVFTSIFLDALHTSITAFSEGHFSKYWYIRKTIRVVQYADKCTYFPLCPYTGTLNAYIPWLLKDTLNDIYASRVCGRVTCWTRHMVNIFELHWINGTSLFCHFQ